MYAANAVLEYTKHKLCIGRWHGRTVPNMAARNTLFAHLLSPVRVVADGHRHVQVDSIAMVMLPLYGLYVTQPKLFSALNSKAPQSVDAFLGHKKSQTIPMLIRGVNRHIYTAVTLAVILCEFARSSFGVSPELMDTLYDFSNAIWEKKEPCPICLTQDRDKDPPVSVCPKGHVYHKPCLLEWFSNKSEATCPECRTQARKLQGIALAAAIPRSATARPLLLQGAGYAVLAIAAMYSIHHNRKAGHGLVRLAARHEVQ